MQGGEGSYWELNTSLGSHSLNHNLSFSHLHLAHLKVSPVPSPQVAATMTPRHLLFPAARSEIPGTLPHWTPAPCVDDCTDGESVSAVSWLEKLLLLKENKLVFAVLKSLFCLELDFHLISDRDLHGSPALATPGLLYLLWHILWKSLLSQVSQVQI